MLFKSHITYICNHASEPKHAVQIFATVFIQLSSYLQFIRVDLVYVIVYIFLCMSFSFTIVHCDLKGSTNKLTISQNRF